MIYQTKYTRYFWMGLIGAACLDKFIYLGIFLLVACVVGVLWVAMDMEKMPK